MKIKRTLPSISEMIKVKDTKRDKSKQKVSYEFIYNQTQINHISIIDEEEKKEN